MEKPEIKDFPSKRPIMEIKVCPTQDPKQLKENLEKRVDHVEVEDGELTVELEEPEILSRTPGIESYTVEGKEREGLKGEPVSVPVYAKIESERDAVKALLATIEGYDLRVLNSGREWDMRQLRKYNPDIKHLKFDDPKDFLEIEKTISEVVDAEKVEIETPEDEEEIKLIYQEMLT